jgi:hypothetical protein
MANEVSVLQGKKKLLAGWVLWPVVTGVLTIVFVKVLNMEPKAAAELAAMCAGSIPLYLLVEGARDIRRAK